MAIEYQLGQFSSIVLQSVTQSSIFPKTHKLKDLESNQEQRNFNLIIPTNLIMSGYKFNSEFFVWEIGFSQDYSNYGNETDFVAFIETGIQW